MDQRFTRRARSLAATAVVATLMLGWLPGSLAGPRPDEQIIGGTPTKPGNLPFVAMIWFYGSTSGPWCMGTLIAPDQVVTAARCMFDGDFDQIGPETFQVSFNGDGQKLDEQEQFAVEQVSVHPGFNPLSCFYPYFMDYELCHDDVAVLTLASPVRGITPVSLVGSGDSGLTRAGRQVTVAGWGGFILNLPIRQRLHQARIPVYDAERCRRTWEYLNHGSGSLRFSPSQHFCTYKVNVSACYSEFGSPALVKDGRRWTLAGLFQSTMMCAEGRWPGVYTRLSDPAINQWVRTTARLAPAGSPRLAPEDDR